MLLERLVTAIELIASSLALLAKNPGTAPTPAADEGPKPARGRPRAAAPTDQQPPAEAAPAAQSSGAAKPAAGAAADTKAPLSPEEASKLPEYVPLREATLKLVNHGAEGKAAAINVLSKYGVRKAAEAPVEKWGALRADLEAELAKLTGGDDNFA